MAAANPHFLSTLVHSFVLLETQDSVKTADFVAACNNLLPIFDGLGSIFAAFPKADLQAKANSLHEIQGQLETLFEVVDADKQAGTITQKGSRGRNLQRLVIIQDFVRHIFVNLLADPAKLFRVAVSEAYDVTLGKIHTWAVRTAIKAGLYTLPSTDNFLRSIGETAESGMQKGQKLVDAANPVLQRLYAMYDDISMPGSDVRFLPK